jgi:hypothetical protein
VTCALDQLADERAGLHAALVGTVPGTTGVDPFRVGVPA